MRCASLLLALLFVAAAAAKNYKIPSAKEGSPESTFTVLPEVTVEPGTDGSSTFPPTVEPGTDGSSTFPPTVEPGTDGPFTFPTTVEPGTDGPFTFPPTVEPVTDGPSTFPPTVEPGTDGPSTFPPTVEPGTDGPSTFPPTVEPGTVGPSTFTPTVEPGTDGPSTFPPTVETESPESEEDSHEFELVLAKDCDAEACQLPFCRCSSTNIPGGLAPRDTPQFVMVTFDGAVTVVNIVTYRDVLYSRVNRNQCPVGATFFINHEYSNYQVANELYNNGFEIGLHSVTRRFPQSYWAQATYDILKEEIADQRVQMAHFANIPIDEINGVRMPFLQMAGNNSFHVMKDFGLTYDASWPTNLFRNPGMWPYTLDYASVQDCQIHPCPTASIPGVWVLPIVTWLDLEGFSCNSLEACIFAPDREDEQAWFEFILTNFERHYLNNRAPFSFNINEAYMTAFPAVARAYVRFFDLINNLPDVFMVNSGEVIDWVKNPISIPEYIEQPCKVFTPTQCPASTCVLFNEQTQQQTPQWFQICNVCPRTYPWLGNPLGQ